MNVWHKWLLPLTELLKENTLHSISCPARIESLHCRNRSSPHTSFLHAYSKSVRNKIFAHHYSVTQSFIFVYAMKQLNSDVESMICFAIEFSDKTKQKTKTKHFWLALASPVCAHVTWWHTSHLWLRFRSVLWVVSCAVLWDDTRVKLLLACVHVFPGDIVATNVGSVCPFVKACCWGKNKGVLNISTNSPWAVAAILRATQLTRKVWSDVAILIVVLSTNLH